MVAAGGAQDSTTATGAICLASLVSQLVLDFASEWGVLAALALLLPQ